MKTIYSLALLLFIAFSAKAQIDKPTSKGNYALGGSISYTKETETSSLINQTNLASAISPSIGYFFRDRLMLGIAPSYSYKNDQYRSYPSSPIYFIYSVSTQTIYSFSLSPFIKYYFQSGWFIEAQLGFGHNKEIDDNTTEGSTLNPNYPQTISQHTNNTYNYNKTSYTYGGGYSYFINQKVAIEASLLLQKDLHNGSQATQSLTTASSTSDFKANWSSTYFRIGINVFL